MGLGSQHVQDRFQQAPVTAKGPDITRKDQKGRDTTHTKEATRAKKHAPQAKTSSPKPLWNLQEGPLLARGSWCSGITPAQHAGGPGLNPQLCMKVLQVAHKYFLS